MISKHIPMLGTTMQTLKIGFSIYSPSELDALVERYHPDIVQAPFNVFDRRLETSGWLQRLYAKDIEVHVRSVFLQGILLEQTNHLPKYFSPWHELFYGWKKWLSESNISPIVGCLSAVYDSRVSSVVIGVNSENQLNQIINASKISGQISVPDFSTHDLDLLLPFRWENI